MAVKDTSIAYDALSRTTDVTDNLILVTHHTAYPLNTPGTTADTLSSAHALLLSARHQTTGLTVLALKVVN